MELWYIRFHPFVTEIMLYVELSDKPRSRNDVSILEGNVGIPQPPLQANMRILKYCENNSVETNCNSSNEYIYDPLTIYKKTEIFMKHSHAVLPPT